MRLINTTTLQLEEFASEAGLKYAILSHRWADGEVSFTDMESLSVARTKNGFYKISKCCEEALRRGCQYAWVDTCCIDKRSSSELSEAINSMFRWYKNSEVCFAYLADVGTDGPEILNQFKSSQWVFFYNSAWLRFGSKHRLVNQLVEASGVSSQVLLGERSIFEFSIAQRMCWASRRKTTRIEDRAYSLMGMFNVNMAMLYGEGDKAFLRLQEEIIKHSDDASIFAWTGVGAHGGGLLAPTLDCFAQPSNVTVSKSKVQSQERQPWAMTNQGLSIELALTPWTIDTYLAILDCHPPSQLTQDSVVGIFLKRTEGRQFRRVVAEVGDLLIDGSYMLDHREIRFISAYVKQDELTPQFHRQLPVGNAPLYGIKLLPIPDVDMELAITTKAKWDVDSGVVELSPGHCGPLLSIDLLPYTLSLERVQVDLDFQFRPRITMGKRVGRPFSTFLGQNPAIIRGVWDAHFAQTSDWDGTCFVENQWPTGDQFEGAVEDSVTENLFVYEVSADQRRHFIHVMHRPRNGASRVLVAELDIRQLSFKGRRAWILSIRLFPADGASPKESQEVMARYGSSLKALQASTVKGHKRWQA